MQIYIFLPTDNSRTEFAVKQRMKLKVDRHRITEGGIVEVRWDCSDLKTVSGTTITIDNGYKKSIIPVENSGTKKFRLNRSEGATVISLSAEAGGKNVSRKQRITVRPIKESSKKYDSYTTIRNRPVIDFFRNISGRLSRKTKAGWQSIPPQKRHAWIMLGILLICFILSLFWPDTAFYGLGLLTIYLIWTLL